MVKRYLRLNPEDITLTRDNHTLGNSDDPIVKVHNVIIANLGEDASQTVGKDNL